MDLQKRIEDYANLIAKVGVGVKEGQLVIIRVNVESKDFAKELTKACYESGAKKVLVEWNSQDITRLTLENATKETLKEVEEWYVTKYEDLVKEGAAFISVIGADPDGLAGVDSDKLKTANMARSQALRSYMKSIMSDECAWCVVGASTVAWAKKLFPTLSDEEAYLKLWDKILTACRADGNAVKNWEEHIKTLNEKATFLNNHQFKKVRITNKLGTDITVGLPKNHIWQSAGSMAKTSGRFVANIPTEEVYTMPDKRVTEGIVYSAKPLNYSGVLIEDFWLKFKEGKVIDFDAKKGKSVLENLLKTDNGSKQLGELAFVPFKSPISDTKILFLETLYDENAACHIALGKAYPTCIENGVNMTEEELDKAGVNDSLIHVDFMIGEETTNIVGYTESDKEIQIFKDGNWA